MMEPRRVAPIEGLVPRRADGGTRQPSRIRVTVSGSFQSDLDRVFTDRAVFIEEGADVLSPAESDAVGKRRGFTRLSNDLSDDPHLTEDFHLEAIAQSNLLWVSRSEENVGVSTLFEIGYAHACGIPVFSGPEIDDTTIKNYVEVGFTPKQALESVPTNRNPPELKILLDRSNALDEIQISLHHLRALFQEERPMTLGESVQARQMARYIVRILGNLVSED